MGWNAATAMAAIKGTQNAPKNLHGQSLIRGWEGPVRALALTGRDPNGRAPAATKVWPEQIRPRPGGSDWSQIQCYNYQGWGHMRHEYSSAQNTWSLNSWRKGHSRTSPAPLHSGQIQNLHQHWCQPYPTSVTPNFQPLSQLPLLS